MKDDNNQLELEYKKEKEKLTEDLKEVYSKYRIYNLDEASVKEMFKNLEKTTVLKIVDYIDLDSYKLVEGIARTVCKENASEVIAHMDWGLARNFALKSMLLKNIKTTKTVINSLSWKRVNSDTKIVL